MLTSLRMRRGASSFIVSAARVDGQTVTLTAGFSDRHVRYTPKSADIRLVGGDVTQDFELILMSAESASGWGGDRTPAGPPQRGGMIRAADTLPTASRRWPARRTWPVRLPAELWDST